MALITNEQRGQFIEIWKQVLGLPEADLDQSFADLGGTSLMANQLAARLARELGVRLPVIRIFEYPTLRMLLRYLTEGEAPARKASQAENRPLGAASQTSALPDRGEVDVAIIGMACRFPGARDVDEYWANLLDGKDSIRRLSDAELSPSVPEELRRDPRYVRAAGLIDDPCGLDAEFFGINPMEAKLTDPQHRVLLETAWHALEHAGEAGGEHYERTAVYAGVEDNTYYTHEIAPFPEAEQRAGHFSVMTGNEKDFVAMKIAYKLNLKGPAVSVHTACSTSLVAVVMACKSLREGSCDMALAGGSSVHFPTPEGYYFQEGGVFSSDGRCRPFDKDAEGTVFTDGSGLVVLKRLSDAIRDRNTIYAVIKGGAINSDGGDRVSFSAPSVKGQASCIQAALLDADVDAGTIQYVEAHGTATPIGDPIEMEGLRQAFATRSDPLRKQYCGLGSVKSNIGHTTAAAGVASLIKTALSLYHGVIPATLHYTAPNPQLDLENSPFYIIDSKRDWPRGLPLRRAGISSFGIGGTNSHVILEEFPLRDDNRLEAAARAFEVWPVSARTASQRDKLLDGLESEKRWPRDIAHTLQVGRALQRHRGASVRIGSLSVDAIRVTPPGAKLDNPRLAFMFPGQGSQYIEMGKSLCESLPEFRKTFEECCEILSVEMGLDFKKFIFDPQNKETLENTRFTQPALFAIEVSLAKLLIAWGIEPDLMVGHSIGEFVAAHLAGVFSLKDALRLIAARGRLMADLPRGRMLSVRGALDSVLAAAGESVDVASVNGPVHCVLAGPDAQIDRIIPRLEGAGLVCRPLHTSHAFHSAMMEPVVEPFLEIVRSVQLSEPQRTIISTVTAQPMTGAEATNAHYWANHLRATVKFSPALFKAIDTGANIFLEIGPRTTLTSLATQHFVARPAAKDCVAIASLADKPDALSEVGGVGAAIAKLWCAGIDVPWDRIWAAGRKVPLVSRYPFEHKDFRFSEGRVASVRTSVNRGVEAGVSPQAASHEAAHISPQPAVTASIPELLKAELTALCSEYAGIPIQRPEATFVECGLDSLVLMQIGVELGKRYGVSVGLRDLMEGRNSIVKLAEYLAAQSTPDRLAHLQAKALAAASPAASRPVASSTPAVPAVAMLPVAGPIDANLAQSIYRQLEAFRLTIDAQLQQLKQICEPPPGQSASSATPASRAMGAPDPEVEQPLLRAHHVQPIRDNAFRMVDDAGREAWFIFESQGRTYRRLN